MTLIFFHLPKTGGSSIHNLIQSCLPDNTNQITIANDNISSIDGSLLSNFDYIHLHAFSHHSNDSLSYYLKNSTYNAFTILRYPLDYFKSFWKHSRLLAPQVVPLNERVIPFHQRYPNLGDMIDELVIKDARNIFHLNSELISTIKADYCGFSRFIWGQVNELKNLGWHANGPDLKYFLLEKISVDIAPFINYISTSIDLDIDFDRHQSMPKKNQLHQSDTVQLTEAQVSKILFLAKSDLKKWLEFA